MEIQRQGEVIVFTPPPGRLDNNTASDFQTKLLACVGSPATTVLIDFTDVEYISSAGLRAMMLAAKQSKATNGRLAAAGLSLVLKEIFEISRFYQVVSYYETIAEAITALS